MTWQKRHEDGLCVNCGGKLTTYLWRCDACQKAQRKRDRGYKRCGAWKKGKRGRPPKVPA